MTSRTHAFFDVLSLLFNVATLLFDIRLDMTFEDIIKVGKANPPRPIKPPFDAIVAVLRMRLVRLSLSVCNLVGNLVDNLVDIPILWNI